MSFYQLLQLPFDASLDDIKQSFQKLALIHHPDKNPHSAQDFVHILHAYKTLSNPATRKLYDQKHLPPVPFDAIDIDDMDYHDSVFSTSCRCSGIYEITEAQLEDHVSIVPCSQCSLHLKIIYTIVEDEKE
jgi:curved DNA-binding protein CbpA